MLSCLACCLLSVACSVCLACCLQVACCMVDVVGCMCSACCLLRVACCRFHGCMLRVCLACCKLPVACAPLHIAGCVLHVVCCMLHAAYCMLSVACSMLRVAWCCLLRVACCMLHVAGSAADCADQSVVSVRAALAAAAQRVRAPTAWHLQQTMRNIQRASVRGGVCSFAFACVRARVAVAMNGIPCWVGYHARWDTVPGAASTAAGMRPRLRFT